MNGTHAGRGHLDDAVLLRLLDDGDAVSLRLLDDGDAAALRLGDDGDAVSPRPRDEGESEEHLRACPVCAARSEALARRSGAVSAALRAAHEGMDAPRWDAEFLARIGVEASTGPSGRGAGDRRVLPFPRAWVSRTAFRWAAVLAVLVALGSVEPVRAWVGETAKAVWGALTGAGEATDAADAADPRDGVGQDGVAPGADSGTEVGVTLDGSELRLEILGSGPDSVMFELFDPPGATRATARIRGGVGESEIVATAGGFRVSVDGGQLAVRIPFAVDTILVVRDGVERRMEARDGVWSPDVSAETPID